MPRVLYVRRFQGVRADPSAAGQPTTVYIAYERLTDFENLKDEDIWVYERREGSFEAIERCIQAAENGLRDQPPSILKDAALAGIREARVELAAALQGRYELRTRERLTISGKIEAGESRGPSDPSSQNNP